MSDIGRFVLDDTSAYLEYTADMERGIFRIENLDTVGYAFLISLEVGNTITLQKGDREELSLEVMDLHGGVSYILCRARTL